VKEKFLGKASYDVMQYLTLDMAIEACGGTVMMAKIPLGAWNPCSLLSVVRFCWPKSRSGASCRKTYLGSEEEAELWEHRLRLGSTKTWENHLPLPVRGKCDIP
jgi:hypothetical protein